MAERRKKAAAPEPIPGIESVTVQGFKSIRDELTLEFRPLTILCGANSSGKTSIMQPLLMMKQTLESPVDPGPLRIWGAHVRFRNLVEFFSRSKSCDNALLFGVKTRTALRSAQIRAFWSPFGPEDSMSFRTNFSHSDKLLTLVQSAWDVSGGSFNLVPGHEVGSDYRSYVRRRLVERFGSRQVPAILKSLEKELGSATRDRFVAVPQGPLSFDSSTVGYLIERVLHLQGLRGIPERAYPRLAVGTVFPGTFEGYTASVLFEWLARRDDRLANVEADLAALGLTSRVGVEELDATQVEVRVGRLRASGSDDLVNIADVGIGVSQVLPVVVALHAAEPGTIVYIEQPELHLHPRAQQALAKLLVAAAKRKVRVVVETHSDLLLLGIQTLVAEGEIDPADVGLHWFHRDDEGVTRMTRAELQPDGSFGEWPEDFGETRMDAEVRFIAAYENRHRPKRRKK
jgi:AAA domain, putative AbiEii toxin, Type IV TA system/AAA ATPase domain